VRNRGEWTDHPAGAGAPASSALLGSLDQASSGAVDLQGVGEAADRPSMSSASGDGQGEPRERDRGPATDQTRKPLVSCRACRSDWYGATAAHGLSVLGHCSRCGGSLCFAVLHAGAAPQSAEPSVDGDHLEPWQVLGKPGR